MNSAIISGVTTVVCLLFGPIAAYAIARLRFRFKSPVMTLILAISFFPAVAIIAPLFVQYSARPHRHLLGRDHHRYGIRPAAHRLAPGRFLQELPKDLEEAARWTVRRRYRRSGR